MNISSHSILPLFTRIGMYKPDQTIRIDTIYSRTLFFPLLYPFMRVFRIPSYFDTLFGTLIYDKGDSNDYVVNNILPSKIPVTLYDSRFPQIPCKPFSIILY